MNHVPKSELPKSKQELPKSISIDCATFEDRIHQVLDDRLTLAGDQLLMNHAASCPPCTDKLDNYVSVDDSVKLLKTDIDRILNDVRNVPRPRRWTTWPVRTAAVVASLAAMVIVFIGVFQTPEDRTANFASTSIHESNDNIPSQSAIVDSNTSNPNRLEIPPTKTKHHVTPQTSPFSRDFRGYSIPSLNVATISPWSQIPSWGRISSPLDPVLRYSSELPGVRPVQCSLNVTFDLLKKSFAKPVKTENPDLGFYSDRPMLAAA